MEGRKKFSSKTLCVDRLNTPSSQLQTWKAKAGHMKLFMLSLLRRKPPCFSLMEELAIIASALYVTKKRKKVG